MKSRFPAWSLCPEPRTGRDIRKRKVYRKSGGLGICGEPIRAFRTIGICGEPCHAPGIFPVSGGAMGSTGHLRPLVPNVGSGHDSGAYRALCSLHHRKYSQRLPGSLLPFTSPPDGHAPGGLSACGQRCLVFVDDAPWRPGLGGRFFQRT